MSGEVDESLPVPAVTGWLSILGIVMLSNPGGVMGAVLPTFVDAFVARGMEPADATRIASVDALASAVVTLIAPIFVARIDLRLLAIIGILLDIGGQVMTLEVGSGPLLMIARALAGAGLGLLLAASIAAVAATAMPDRIFGFNVLANQITGVMLLAVIGWAAHRAPQSATFIVVTVLAVICMLFIPALPKRERSLTLQTTTRAPSGKRLGPAVFGITGIFLLTMALGAVWPIAGQIGRSLGKSAETVSAVYIFCALGGAVAGAFAAALGTRIGRRVPLLVGVAGLAVSLFLVATPMFEFALVMTMFFLSFSLPYFLAIQALLDSGGRLAVLGSAMLPLGLGGGQLAAAAVTDTFGLKSTTLLGSVLAVCSLLLVLNALRLIARDSIAPRMASDSFHE